MSSKKEHGKFYTTNYDYILQGMVIPKYVDVVEPFVGNGDLLKFFDNTKHKIECYDIDDECDVENIIIRNTLLTPPNYSNKFVITNPPYLARNKSKDKTIFNLYNLNDLYKCFIQTLINVPPIGGILILPLNFFCSIRKEDIILRKKFLNKFNISRMNIFEEQVFDDTTSAVCSIMFDRSDVLSSIIPTFFISKNKTEQYSLPFNDENNYTIGGEIYSLPQNNKIRIDRATNKNKNSENITNILVKCIDNDERINMKIVENNKRYIDTSDKQTARSFLTPVISPKLSIEQQIILVEKWNRYMKEKREIYNSMFLSSYREGNRKRISFSLVFIIINYLLSN